MNMENILKMAKVLEEQYGKKVLGIEAVSEYLGLDEISVRGLVESGELKAIGSEEHLMFKAIQVIKFEYDIVDINPTRNTDFNTPETEGEEMKVSKGSIYATGSIKNPVGLAFSISFDDGTSIRFKVRGKNEKELWINKSIKVTEELEKYRRKRNGEDMGDTETKKNGKKIKLFRDVADEWYVIFEAEQRSKGNSYSNIRSTKETIIAINKVIGDMAVHDINMTIGNDLMIAISQDKETGKWRSKSYAIKIRRIFTRIMEYALVQGYTENVIIINKLNLNKNLTEPSKNDRFLSEECIRDLLEVIQDHPRFRTLVNLILSSGMRQSEALAICIDDLREREGIYNVYVSKADIEVDANVFEIVYRLKDDEEPREITIAKETFDMVKDYYYETMKDKEMARLKREAGTEKLIFTNQYGKVINKRTLYHSFTRYLKVRLGEEDKVRLHMLRHSFASLMCDDIPLELVSEILGHRDVAITQKFYKSITSSQKKMISDAATNLMNKFKREDK